MDVLSINFIVEDKDLLFENNDWLNNYSCPPGLQINLSEKATKAEQFVDLLAKSESEYVMFCNEYNKWKIKDLKKLLSALKKENEPVFRLKRIDEKFGEISKNPFYFGRYIFQTENIKKISFAHNELYHYEEKIIFEILRNSIEVPCLKQVKINTDEPLEWHRQKYLKQFDKLWYTNLWKNILIPISQRNDFSLTQKKLVLLTLKNQIISNRNKKNKGFFNEIELEEYFSCIDKVLNCIDDRQIIDELSFTIPAIVLNFLISRKHKGQVTYPVDKPLKGKIPGRINGIYTRDDTIQFDIRMIEWENNKLSICGHLKEAFWLDKGLDESFEIKLNDKVLQWEETGMIRKESLFGHVLEECPVIRIVIDGSEFGTNDKITFRAKINGKESKVMLAFTRTLFSRLYRSQWSSWRFGDKAISFDDNDLRVYDYRAGKHAVMEIGVLTKVMRSPNDVIDKIKIISLRVHNKLTKGFYNNKKVWVFYDKLYKAGDNAEYLFRYCMKNNPEAQCYYLINKDSPDYPALKKEFGKNILEFGSMRELKKCLHTTLIFATHVRVSSFCGYSKLIMYVKDLINTNVVCIQHGLTIQDMVANQNKLFDNTKRYFCASKYEIENLMQPEYGYDGYELCLTGCPRYDGLVDKKKSQILITPTWRANLVIQGNAVGTKKEYNPAYKKSKYFELYNNLINDSRIMEAAKKHNVSLIYLLHPTLNAQSCDYTTNEFAKVLSVNDGISYEDLLTESSLMVTDYSGVQFDFAYMKKPIIYYHPKELPPQYDNGVFNYDTMAFGPICDEYDNLVNEICDCIERNFTNLPEYNERIEDFFEYLDNNNCKRIMDEIVKSIDEGSL